MNRSGIISLDGLNLENLSFVILGGNLTLINSFDAPFSILEGDCEELSSG